MARVSSSGDSLPPTPLGAKLQSVDPRTEAFGQGYATDTGMSQRELNNVITEINNYQDLEDITNALAYEGIIEMGGDASRGFMGALNQQPSNNPNPYSGKYAIQQAILTGDYETADRLGYSRPTRSNGYVNAADFYFRENNASFSQSYSEEYGTAVALSDIPTSSTNYKRPRTVAAGYDVDTATVTVVFRDGTFWNYQHITPDTWIAFHNSISKGKGFINKKNKNQAQDGLLLQESMGDNGPADMSELSPAAQEFLYRVARTAQISYNLNRNKKSGPTHVFKAARQPNLNRIYNAKSTAKAMARKAKNQSLNNGKNPNQP